MVEKPEQIYNRVQIILLMFLPAYICFQDKKKRFWNRLVRTGNTSTLAYF